jgi:hypothetical protein
VFFMFFFFISTTISFTLLKQNSLLSQTTKKEYLHSSKEGENQRKSSFSLAIIQALLEHGVNSFESVE